MSGFILSTNQSTMSLPFKPEYTPIAVVRLVNIFNCLHTVKDEGNVTSNRKLLDVTNVKKNAQQTAKAIV